MTHILQHDDNDDTLLENLVFGTSSKEADNLGEASGSDDEAPEEISVKKPAWVDEDDANPVNIETDRSRRLLKRSTDSGGKIAGGDFTTRLRKQFEKSTGGTPPAWAQPKRKKFESGSSDEESDDDNLKRRTGKVIGTEVGLPKGVLEFKKLRNLAGAKSKSFVKSVEFHKQSQVLLSAGENSHLLIYQIDGSENPLMQDIGFDRFPIQTARFSACGERIIVGSRLQSFFYYYDMISARIVKVPRIRALTQQNKMDKFCIAPDGKFIAFRGPAGYIHLLSGKTYEWMHSLKMNGDATDFVFSPEGNRLHSFGDEGLVYTWDLRSLHCIHKFVDEGCVKGTCLDVSADGKYIACGSNSGVVNLYDASDALQSAEPRPQRAFLNLTTPITQVRFSPRTEILGFCSEFIPKSMRLAHIGSRTVFTNFPSRSDRMEKPRSFDLSPNGGYMAIGNNRGHTTLYRLRHYAGY